LKFVSLLYFNSNVVILLSNKINLAYFSGFEGITGSGKVSGETCGEGSGFG
jgi:hypothetical protein